MAGFSRKGWPGPAETAGRLSPKRVAGCRRNKWPDHAEIRIRGSRDFGGASEYQAFLRNLLKERNAPSTKPSHKLDPFEGYLKQRIDPVCPNALSATVLMREMRLSPLPSCHQEVFACFGGGPEEFLYGKEALCGELKWVSIGASWQEQAQDAAEARKSL